LNLQTICGLVKTVPGKLYFALYQIRVTNGRLKSKIKLTEGERAGISPHLKTGAISFFNNHPAAANSVLFAMTRSLQDGQIVCETT
jgi:hypothetical protein